MRKNKFSKTPIAASLSLLLGTMAINPLYAEEADDGDDEQVIVVTGIRGSLASSMNTKRDAIGVVDAITSEDIGKFPDTNLAESLQRITGVSISRVNGEGSEVTVRGFAGDNNMITLNGRMMPAATTYGAGSGADGTTRGGSTRAFDFANLASEGIKSVEVYKTGKANIATGGIGATVNIITAKPLDKVGFSSSAGVKAIHDTTNRTGSSITPEVQAILSFANDDQTIGVGLSASHQERDSGYTGATVNNWNIGRWSADTTAQTLYGNPDRSLYVNEPAVGQLYARPNDIRYAFSNTERVRDNAQLTFQFRPNDMLTATVDYTFAENNIKEARGEVTNWLQRGSNFQQVEFDNSALATPIFIRESYVNGIDEGYEQQWREQRNTLNSAGINLEFEVNDRLTLTLDAHDSDMFSRGVGPRNTGELAVGLGAPTVIDRTWTFGPQLPRFTNIYDDSIRGANGNGINDAGDVGSSIARLRNAAQLTEIEQVKLDGRYEFDDLSFDFGIETRSMESATQQTAGNNIALGNWDVANPGEFGDLIRPFDVSAEFDDYSTAGTPGVGYIADARAIYDAAVGQYPGIPGYSEASLSTNNLLVEDTSAAYVQAAFQGDFGDMPYNVLVGVRYETTDVESTSLVGRNFFIWEGNDDVVSSFDGSVLTPRTETAEYSNVLPSIDFDIEIREDLKGRFSASKTIARAGIGNLGVSASNFSGDFGSTLLGSQPTANASNPGLKPLESTNLDISLEWYFDETSYVSFGYFRKDVANFIGTTQVLRDDLGVRDVTGGPRAQAAFQALEDLGIAVDNTTLFNMMVLLENPDVFPGGAAEYDPLDPVQANQLESVLDDLEANGDDPFLTFITATPDNSRDAELYGFELAVQHFFGETGFGVQANYTMVEGDIGFDDLGDPTESQFALIGLSDTANLIGMYEKDGWQVRLAYNWRGENLAEVNRGSSNNPRYIEAYSQIDLNVSYDVTENLSLSFEGLNLTEENDRQHGRNSKQLWFLTELGARYQLGARYTF